MPDGRTSPLALRPPFARPAGGAFATDPLVLGAFLLLGLALRAGLPTPLALAALAVAAALAALSPPAAVAAVAAAAPLVFRPVAVGGGAYSLLELGILAGAAGLGARLLLTARRPATRARARAALRPTSVSLAAAALLAVAALSLVTLADPDHRRESVREFRTVILGPLLYFGLCRWSFREAAARRLAALALVGAGVLVAGAALVEVLSGAAAVRADEVERARATYPHPNNLALYLERVAVFAAGCGLVAGTHRRPERLAWWGAGAVLLAGTAATLSRGALLSAAVGLAVVLAALGSRRAWAVYGAVLAAGVATFALLAPERLVASGGFGGGSTRLPLWRSTLRMIADHPVFGVGLDQFYALYWRRYVEPVAWPERYTAHPHNLFLDLWVRLGILGLAAAGWVAWAVVRAARRSWPRRTAPAYAPYPLAVGATAALAAGLTHGLVDNGFFLPDLAVLTWLFVALVEAPPADAPPLDPQATDHPRA